MRSARLLGLATLFVVALLTRGSAAQTTAFTYQGQLNISGSPANGSYDFEFRLFGQSSGGSQLGPTETRSSLGVANGNFTVTLDFGAQFPGAARFLEIKVGAAPSGATTLLAPRQQIYSAPYSIKSLNADQLGGIGTTGFIQNTTTQQAASNFNISGSGTTAGPMNSQRFNLPAAGGGVIPFFGKRDATHIGLCGGDMAGVFLGCVLEADLTDPKNGTTLTIMAPLIAEDDVTIDDNATINGSAIIGNDLTVTNHATFNANVVINSITAQGTNHLCLAPGNIVGGCGSSLRFKNNVAPFKGSLDVIDRLKPISFTWKNGAGDDVGFGAEDVAKIDPRLVTYNSKGEVFGVKYDRLSVAFANAFKEQQAQIGEQQKQLSQQKELIEKQQSDLAELKALVCSQNSAAAICKPR